MSHFGLTSKNLGLSLPHICARHAALRVHLDMCVVPTLQALADAFCVNKSVTYVDLSYNKFGDEGVKARAPQRGPRLGRRNIGTIM